MFSELKFDERGLVPVVAQDAVTGEVLTLAYANEESLRLTVETGELHFYSRSREEIWRKGETSGNVLKLRQLRYDCDGDALVALVEPTGPACHTNERSCFYRELGGSAATAPDAPAAPGEPAPVAHEALGTLERTLRSRAAERPEGS
jgi:phosphoribosyl-ATP pyrophosphohydrolase/phosphoribosyl-AMP cyclohydrolase